MGEEHKCVRVEEHRSVRVEEHKDGRMQEHEGTIKPPLNLYSLNERVPFVGPSTFQKFGAKRQNTH